MMQLIHRSQIVPYLTGSKDEIQVSIYLSNADWSRQRPRQHEAHLVRLIHAAEDRVRKDGQVPVFFEALERWANAGLWLTETAGTLAVFASETRGGWIWIPELKPELVVVNRHFHIAPLFGSTHGLALAPVDWAEIAMQGPVLMELPKISQAAQNGAVEKLWLAEEVIWQNSSLAFDLEDLAEKVARAGGQVTVVPFQKMPGSQPCVAQVQGRFRPAQAQHSLHAASA